MDTETYIINDIAAFGLDTPIRELQNAFNQLTYSHIPITDDEGYLGCLSETDAHCFDASKSVRDFQYALESFHVRKDTHWLDILEAFALHGSNIMPVLGTLNNYLGYFELSDVMSLFNNTPFLNETGGIIVVEKGIRDYSFSEISQIVESNEGKVLGLFISKMTDETVQATIKIGHSGMNEIVQTFRRYSYAVISNHDEDKLLEDLKNRSRYLDKYLNI